MITDAIALKEDQVQFVTNQSGDIPLENPEGYGLYYQDTRFLSRFELTVNGQKPVFLSNSVTKHYIATFQFINPSFVMSDGRRVPQQTISIWRARFVSDAGLFERIGFMNCNRFPVDLEVGLAVDADFKDMFAVRGFKGQRIAGEIALQFGHDSVTFAYKGRDGLRRTTDVAFNRPPEPVSPREVRFTIHLEPQKSESLVVQVQPRIGRAGKRPDLNFEGELERLARSYSRWDQSCTRIVTDNVLFDRELLRASRYDVRALLENTPEGLVPDAGVPWYAVPFGRDSIITALQTLMYNPKIAEGTLRFLAAHQGREINAYREEEPGKILHELRRGELARLGEVPHTPYFGTVDATPLFLVLFVETMRWTGSERLYSDLLPHAMSALEWVDRYGDKNGDGYLDYAATHSGGVVNQGWKDSVNSVQYDDGANAVTPIALVEVQGYVYQAKVGMARLAREHGDLATAARLDREAAILKDRFNHDFWMEDEAFYALALDGQGRQVRAITSNVGHCLWSGICDDTKAAAVVRRLMQPDMFSGWGLRTLSATSPNYNPMSYHNGSVWPHDTAITAVGMRRYGFSVEASHVVEALFEGGFRVDDYRLPELFCGFPRDRRFNSKPAPYVVSCSPQAWAAGSVFMLLQAMLGVEPDAQRGTVQVDPVLPALFNRLTLEHVRVGQRLIDIHVERVDGSLRTACKKRSAARSDAISAA